MAPVIVWLYKKAIGDELRYSIRSLTETLPCDGAVIVGDKPDWFTGQHIEARTEGHFNDNTWNALKMLSAANVADDMILANDDMFCLSQGCWPAMPVYHRGPLDEQLERMRRDRASSPYTKMLNAAKTALVRSGHEAWRDYEAHVPLPITADGLKIALGVYEAAGSARMSKRTVYGNANSIGGQLIPGPMPGRSDVKVRSLNDPHPLGPWLSTTEATFTQRYRDTIADVFTEPSKWER